MALPPSKYQEPPEEGPGGMPLEGPESTPPPPPVTLPPYEGSGEPVPRSLMRLYHRAQREGWPVGPAERALAVHEALTILHTCHSDQRKLGAIKALIQADAINVSRERIKSQEKP